MPNPSPTEIKSAIPHTWPLFFMRHGNFTAVQQQAVLPILVGENSLIMASTASGKTEAVMAPLIERLWATLTQDKKQLTILYICPTKALVKAIYERLHLALTDTPITVSQKTGDTPAFSARRASDILITTPESTDSLLCRIPRLFSTLQAIVIDEIHLFDNTPRGDQLRCLLPRIERIRNYAQPDILPTQRIGLSATVSEPEGVVGRYLHDGLIIGVSGRRKIEVETVPLYDLNELVSALSRRAQRKSILFCNSRFEVEQAAVYLRNHLAQETEIFVHHGMLDRAVRQETEERFAEASVAICVATSTLELGIDIGSVDDVVLLGIPYDFASFMQRIGRGARRTAKMRVLCLPKSPGEWARLEGLLHLAEQPDIRRVGRYQFRPSVLVQQVFSLLKQSPTGGIRLADIRRIAPDEVTDETLRKIVSHLSGKGYLQPGRLGEWRPAALLQELFDQHEIYGNIGFGAQGALAVDAYTGRTIARTETTYPIGKKVLLGGRVMRVTWRDRNRFGLTTSTLRPDEDYELLRIQRAYAAIPYEECQAVASLLGLNPGHMVAHQLPFADNDRQPGMILYHFLGSIWGLLLTAILQSNRLSASYINEYSLHLQIPLTGHQLPIWDDDLVARVAKRQAQVLAKRLALGRFYDLLEPQVAHESALSQLNVDVFKSVYMAQRVLHSPNLELLDKLSGLNS